MILLTQLLSIALALIIVLIAGDLLAYNDRNNEEDEEETHGVHGDFW